MNNDSKIQRFIWLTNYKTTILNYNIKASYGNVRAGIGMVSVGSKRVQ